MTTPSSKEQTSPAPIPRILHYFIMWGLDYGFIFGFAAGSMVIPGFGTIIGALLGLVIGGLYGGILGLGMSATYRGIAPDTDLDAYGQKLVRRAVGALTALNLIILPIVPLLLYSYMLGRIPIWDRGEFPEVVLKTLVLAGGALSVFTAFVVAATARHFPHWMVHEQRLNAPMAHAFVMRHEMETAFHQIRKRSSRWWLPLLFMSLVTIIFLMNPAAYSAYSIGDWLSLGGGVLFLSIVGTWVGRIYLSLVNAAVLTFIKRVILRDYFPNLTGARYRARVTLIALIATLVATWWTFFFAPVIALVMAFFVYHTVALPDEMQEKSKRKEADLSTSKAKVPSALLLPEETDGELIDLDLSRLADPAATQVQQG
jgi:hypothetical protein